MKYIVCVEGTEHQYFAFSGRTEAESFALLPRDEGQVATIYKVPAGASGVAMASGLSATLKENHVPWQVGALPVDHAKGLFRPCLRCGAVFCSKGITNRICGRCKNRRQ
jgi:hypothetical protein